MPTVPLHQRVTLACGCCGLLSEMMLNAETDQRVCGPCRHHGSEPGRIRAAHVSAVMERERVLRERLGASDRERAGLTEVIATEFETAPPESALSNIATAVMRNARQQTESALRSRDDEMVALWRTIQLHREGTRAGKCVCGQPVSQCRVLGALDGIEASVRRWERAQEERAAAQKPHSLPHEHPFMSARRGRGLHT